MNADPIKILSTEIVLFFEAENLLRPVINSKRKLSTSSFSSSSESHFSPSDDSISSRSFAATYHDSGVKEIEIPEHNSPETYEYLGFNRETAVRLWGYHANAPSELPDTDFLDYARFQLEESGVEDATPIAQDWVAVMDALGINHTLQSAIMIPEFDDVRATASCKFWLMDARTTLSEAEGSVDRPHSSLETRQVFSNARLYLYQRVRRSGSWHRQRATKGDTVGFSSGGGTVGIFSSMFRKDLDPHTFIKIR